MSTTSTPTTTTSGGLFPTLFPSASAPAGAPAKSSSLYLFTFLITLVVLAGIIGGLVFRSVIIRRRFQRRVAEAIARGERPPQRGGGIMATRMKPRVKLGPRPEMWEAEMLLKKEVATGDILRQIQPMSISYNEVPIDATAAPEPVPSPPSRARRFANYFQADTETSLPVGPSRRPILPPRNDSMVASTPPRPAELPPVGTPLSLGVMIAMPHHGEMWRPREEEEEMDLPHVVLGIATVKLQ